MRDFVNNGGILYVSNLAFIYVKTSFPGYINFSPNSYIGKGQKIVANIVNNDLVNYVGKNTIEIDYNSSDWPVIESVSVNTDIYVKGSEVWHNKPLIVGFNYGKGRVYYTTFSHESETGEDLVKLLEYFVFNIELNNKIKENKEKLENEGFVIKERNIGGLNQAEEKSYTFKVSEPKDIAIILNWEDATLKLSIYGPDGILYNEWQTDAPPIYVTIPDAIPGTWTYTIKAIDVPFRNYPFVVTIGVKEKIDKTLVYFYPNPFNPDIEVGKIRFSLSKPGLVTIKIYDVSGTLVATLVSNVPMAANTPLEVEWNGKNDQGRIVANGVYFYRITSTAEEAATGKIAVLR